MRLLDIAATPHPSGNRIDVSWMNPEPALYPGVRLVRREKTHPATPDDGAVVAEGTDLPFTPGGGGARRYTVSDTGLKGETVYYYTLFPYSGSPPDYQFDVYNRTARIATSSYDMAGQMQELLPALYHRYDAAVANGERGPLQRFLEVTGSQLDLLYSFARSTLDLYDIERVDGRLLPLLADWIGWDTNHRLDVAAQRNELRSAPYLYRAIGIVPTVEATVKRVLGWESRAKEFVHNIAVSNAPERLNIWILRRAADGAWLPSSAPLSLDYEYEGRPAAATDADGVLWLVYSTLRNGRWDLWYKSLITFAVPPDVQDALDAGVVTPELRGAFQEAGFALSQRAVIAGVRDGWDIREPERDERFSVRVEAGGLIVYRWTPSARLTNTASVDKHPSVLFHDGILYVFWDSYDTTTGRWRVLYRIREDGSWSRPASFGDDGVDRRSPAVIADHTGHLWAFWLERRAQRWRMRYLRQGDGGAWEHRASHLFPEGEGGGLEVHADIFALFQPAGSGPEATIGATPRIWVFWSRKVRVGGGQTRWQIACRTATGIDPSEFTWVHSWNPDFPDHLTVDTTASPVDTSFRTYYVHKPLDWSPVLTLPESLEDFSVREPAAFLNEDGQIELFFSSDRDGSWSIWRASLTESEPPAWEAPERLTLGPYAQRAPYPCLVGEGALLLYRSNESVRYASDVYRATETLDARYAGSTSVDARNLARVALRERFDDFQTYVYDTGENGIRSDRDWYARDTVGVYLDAATEDQRIIVRNRNLITNVLQQFLPAPVRVVFIIPIVTSERFYTYDFPGVDPPRRIGEEYSDHIESPSSESYSGLADEYADTMAGWAWAYSWSEEHTEPVTVETAADPVDSSVRTWHIGVEPGG